MGGIGVVIGRPECFINSIEVKVKERGFGTVYKVEEGDVVMMASALGAQGPSVSQPLVFQRGVFAFNGELLGFQQQRKFPQWLEDLSRFFVESDASFHPNASDTNFVRSLLDRICDDDEWPMLFQQYMDLARGPWTVVIIFDGQLFAFRDRLGRRPMAAAIQVRGLGNELVHADLSQSFLPGSGSCEIATLALVSSPMVGLDVQWLETNPRMWIHAWKSENGNWFLEQKNRIGCGILLTKSKVKSGTSSFEQIDKVVDVVDDVDIKVKGTEALQRILSKSTLDISGLIETLEESVRLRARTLHAGRENRKIALLWSGGVDCSLISAVLIRWLPTDWTLELINVAVVADPCKESIGKGTLLPADRITGLMSYFELCKANPSRAVDINFICCDFRLEHDGLGRVQDAICSLPWTGQRNPRNEEHMQINIGAAIMAGSGLSCCLSNMSNRQLACCGGRFYQLSLTQGEAASGLLREAAGHLGCYEGLNSTEMTQTAAQHLWQWFTDLPFQRVASLPNVMFSGQGADELFAGYQRYTDMNKEQLEGAMEHDIWDLWRVNLPRDDRLMEAAKRIIRLPYVDQVVISFVRETFKAQELLDAGDGVKVTKLLIRLALITYGMNETACLKKRAIQFGSGSALREKVINLENRDDAVRAI